MDAKRWATSVDPLEMVCYLEDAGCYLEFEAFFMDCFNRIRHELVHPDVLATPFTFGVDVDELTDAAQAAIDDMNRHLTELDEDSKEWKKLDREIRYSKTVLARDYHDFGEANRFLSAYLIEISDDALSESRIQADFLRSNYDFPFVPRGEE
ncbi:MAG: hypothetical protein KDB00_25565 [Planctomycetales bacterium]|nr:hypothetical protein [Planctomycetales bacterium]